MMWIIVQDLWPLLALATVAGVWTMHDIARSVSRIPRSTDHSGA